MNSGNHSLEVRDDTLGNLHTLFHVMDLTQCYIKDNIHYRTLYEEDLYRGLFDGFIRHQKVEKCRRKENGIWVVQEAPFIDDLSGEYGQYRRFCICRLL